MEELRVRTHTALRIFLAREHHVVAEIEQSIRFRLPSSIPAIRIAGRRAEQRDRSDDVNAPGIEQRPDLNHFVCRTPDEHVKARLTGRCDRRVRRLPVTEDARAVSGKVDAFQRDASIANPGARAEKKFVVENRADTRPQRAGQRREPVTVAQVVHLRRATTE